MLARQFRDHSVQIVKLEKLVKCIRFKGLNKVFTLIKVQKIDLKRKVQGELHKVNERKFN